MSKIIVFIVCYIVSFIIGCIALLLVAVAYWFINGEIPSISINDAELLKGMLGLPIASAALLCHILCQKV